MTLANGWVLHFLWLLPMTGFILVVKHRRRRRSMERFAEPALMTRLTLDDHKGRRFIKGILILCALGILLLALAGPRWGNRYQEVSRKGVDIMLLVDVSRSMMVWTSSRIDWSGPEEKLSTLSKWSKGIGSG